MIVVEAVVTLDESEPFGLKIADPETGEWIRQIVATQANQVAVWKLALGHLKEAEVTRHKLDGAGKPYVDPQTGEAAVEPIVLRCAEPRS